MTHSQRSNDNIISLCSAHDDHPSTYHYVREHTGVNDLHQVRHAAPDETHLPQCATHHNGQYILQISSYLETLLAGITEQITTAGKLLRLNIMLATISLNTDCNGFACI